MTADIQHVSTASIGVRIDGLGTDDGEASFKNFPLLEYQKL
jgi:hypothetical protein